MSRSALTPVAPAAAHPVIDGHTDIYLIVGDPISQVRSPEIFNRIFARFGLNAALVPVQVAPADLADFVRVCMKSGNVKGLCLTIPHKAAALSLADRCSPLAQAAGAINALRRAADGCLEGDLFDGEGFVAGLTQDGLAHAGKRVLLLGAGGAASAIAASLVLGTEAAAELAIYDPALDKSAALVQRLADRSSSQVRQAQSNDPAGFDLIVNATPLGLKAGDPVPCDVARMDAQAAVSDILMKNQPTPLLRAARARGLATQPGFEMLIQQTPLYLEFFGLPDAARFARENAAEWRTLIDPQQGLPALAQAA